jgi:lipopolysaccharide/colanic/teichoic acid biosynthesis glycosyltransferase
MARRAFDIVVSAAGLVLLGPLLGAVALAILWDDGRPVFFSQERVGRGFRRFRIVKFRTMRAGSNGPPITASGDHRVTRVGRVLRTTKLDELPQLWNVLRGDMALVGPRPEVPAYVEMYRGRFKNILSVRPGLTDAASICFRNEEALLARAADAQREYRERILPAKLELAEDYLRRRSLWLDLRILFQTVGAIVRR